MGDKIGKVKIGSAEAGSAAIDAIQCDLAALSLSRSGSPDGANGSDLVCPSWSSKVASIKTAPRIVRNVATSLIARGGVMVEEYKKGNS